MTTRLTTILNIDVPIMLAGMGGVSYSDLAAAVSNAGGYGCLGASTMSSDELASEIAKTRELTDRPFGVDLLTAFPDSLDRNIDLIIEGGATALIAGLGIPTRVIETCHRHGILVMSMCGKVEHARRAVDAGCDVVIAQGTEAGGHTGTVATFPLIPLVVDAVGGSVPVVAAGGIADGRGLAAALALGADGVWVGTRFIATPEARALPGFRETILDIREDQTVISKAFSGKPMRVARNDVTDYFEAHRDELQPFPAQLIDSFNVGRFHLGGGPDAQGVDPTREGYPMGQIAGAIDEIIPAAHIVTSMVSEAREILARLATDVL
jgi:enoyl-[acyl-carrier protein] reductase II